MDIFVLQQRPRSFFDLYFHTLTVSNCHVCFDSAFDLWLVTQVNDSEPHGHLVSFDSVQQNLLRCRVISRG